MERPQDILTRGSRERLAPAADDSGLDASGPESLVLYDPKACPMTI
jgi:hypothetical protein